MYDFKFMISYFLSRFTRTTGKDLLISQQAYCAILQAVFFACSGTNSQALCVELQFLAMSAYPPYTPCGITYHQRKVRYVFCHHTTCAYQAVRAQRMSANDGGIGTYRATALKQRRSVFVLARYGSTRVNHIGKHHARTEEHILLATHTGIYRHVVLNLAIIAQHHVRRDNYVLTYIAVLANDATAHHMAEMPDLCACAYTAAIVNVR